MFTPFTLVVFLISLSTFASAFSFTAGTPSECDNLSISWSGGTGPFQLLIIPVFGTPRNISIPTTSFSGGQGTYALPLALPAGQKFVLTMSDATGFGAGGTTDVMSVGASQGGSCNTTDPGIAFAFQLNVALQQCRPFVFSSYRTAAQPVAIMAVIPSGTSIVLNPPVGSNSFSWTANVMQGTSMIFMMTDALGNQGGSSDIKIVGATDDNTCLNNLSPSSTSRAPTSTAIGVHSTAGHTTSSSSPSATPTQGVPISAIAGTVIGALLFLAVVVTLGLFFLRKRSGSFDTGGGDFRKPSRRLQSDVDLSHDPGRDSHPLDATPYGFSPQTNAPFRPYQSDATPTTHPYSSYTSASSTAHDLYSPSSTIPHDADPFADSHLPPSSQYRTPSQSHPAFSQFYSPSDPLVADPFNSSGPPVLSSAEFSLQRSEQAPSTDSMSTAQRKASVAGLNAYKPQRFIVHTDADDILPPPNDEGVVELPPQYSERPGNATHLTSHYNTSPDSAAESRKS